ncbi:MAG: long-chain-fatty-acyl-CoA reductase, partial [Sphingomonadales bacterium]
EVRAELKALIMDDTYYKLIGRNDGRGAIIVSQESEAVEWAPKLCGRVANLVPIDSIDEAIREMNSYTQTVGVYPDSLKADIRDALAIQGAQRIMSLGYVITSTEASPQDGIEPMRRMVRWITDDTCVAETTPAAWEAVLGDARVAAAE